MFFRKDKREEERNIVSQQTRVTFVRMNENKLSWQWTQRMNTSTDQTLNSNSQTKDKTETKIKKKQKKVVKIERKTKLFFRFIFFFVLIPNEFFAANTKWDVTWPIFPLQLYLLCENKMKRNRTKTMRHECLCAWIPAWILFRYHRRQRRDKKDRQISAKTETEIQYCFDFSLLFIFHCLFLFFTFVVADWALHMSDLLKVFPSDLTVVRIFNSHEIASMLLTQNSPDIH